MGKNIQEYIHHHGENLWDFDILFNLDYENVNHIHPLKQKDVAALITAVKEDPHVIGIIVFGSAIHFNCHSASDLDVLIIKDDTRLGIDACLDQIESDLDIIFYTKLGERLKNEIAKTGVIVYRRDNDV